MMKVATRRVRLLVSVGLALVLGLSTFGLTACGGSSGGGGGSTGGGKPAEDAVKVDEIDWSLEEGIEDVERVMTFSYKNESDYDAVSVELVMKVDEEATSEEIQTAFGGMFEAGYTEEDIRAEEGTLEYEGVVKPGERSEPTAENMTVEERDLLVPDILTVKFVSDGKLYEEYYDNRSESYDQSSEVIDVDQWGEGELASMLPEPDGLLVEEVSESEYYFMFSTIASSQEDFDAYVEACKEAGFTALVTSDEDFYEAENEDGTYDLLLSYLSDGEISGNLTPVAE